MSEYWVIKYGNSYWTDDPYKADGTGIGAWGTKQQRVKFSTFEEAQSSMPTAKYYALSALPLRIVRVRRKS